MGQRRFYDCGLSEKLLYTAFLLLMAIGYLMALVYLYTSHEGHDAKPGVSIEDIVENYYGNRSGTRLKAAIRGLVAGYIQQPEDRYQIMAWLKSGAPKPFCMHCGRDLVPGWERPEAQVGADDPTDAGS